MKVIKSNFGKRHTCTHCNSVLEYTEEDVFNDFITCPVCGSKERVCFTIRNIKDDLVVVCDNCEEEFNYSDKEIVIGGLGLAFCECPYCHEKTIVEDESITLTIDNIVYPTHFCQCSKNEGAVSISDEDINKYIKECFEELKNDYTTTSQIIATGDTYVMVTKLEEDEEYHIFVAKGYYESYIPFDSVNK